MIHIFPTVAIITGMKLNKFKISPICNCLYCSGFSNCIRRNIYTAYEISKKSVAWYKNANDTHAVIKNEPNVKNVQLYFVEQ